MKPVQISYINSSVIILIALSQGLLGLSDLAISYTLKDDLRFSPSKLSFYMSLMSFPWIIKPLWGFISDSYPIMNKRRSPYLLIFGVLQCGCLYFLSTTSHTMLQVLLPLYLINIGVCFCNVIGEALIVEESQKNNNEQSKASNYVSLFFGSRALGTLITAYSSGYLIEALDKEKVFLITACFPLLTILSAFLLHENSSSSLKVSEQLDLLWSVLRKKEIYLPILFIFLFCAVPTGSDAFFYYYTNELHFDPEYMGRLKLVYGVGSLLGMVLYNYVFSEYSFKSLLVSSTLLCMVISLSQILLLTGYNQTLGIPDQVFAIASSFVVQLAAELNLMPLLVLCCKICPKNIEGSLYALLMSTWNFGSMVSGQLGALLMVALGVNENEFGNLWILVLITSFLMVLPLPMLLWVNEEMTEKEVQKKGYDLV